MKRITFIVVAVALLAMASPAAAQWRVFRSACGPCSAGGCGTAACAPQYVRSTVVIEDAQPVPQAAHPAAPPKAPLLVSATTTEVRTTVPRRPRVLVKQTVRVRVATPRRRVLSWRPGGCLLGRCR